VCAFHFFAGERTRFQRITVIHCSGLFRWILAYCEMVQSGKRTLLADYHYQYCRLIWNRTVEYNVCSGHKMATVATTSSNVAVRQLKMALRKEIRQRMKALSPECVTEFSNSICRRLIESTEYMEAKSIFVFLSMGHEVQTRPILAHSFTLGKRVFIPKICGPAPTDMLLYEVRSPAEIDAFPQSPWGIPEPTVEMVSF
jgi:hypothetical protein